MKTFIASDFHGRNPVPLVKSLVKDKKIGRAVFLGDYDEPKILRDILDLKMDKIILIGNHDYDLSLGNEVYSPNLVRPLKEYWDVWGNTLEGKYIRDNLDNRRGIKKGMKVIRRVGNKRAVYVHGSLMGIRSEESPSDVWGRILYDNGSGFTRERRVICNFREMKKNNYWTMFRGHDHFPIVFSTNQKNYTEEIKQINSSIDSIVLKKDDINIASVGAFVEGCYSVFDDKSYLLEFKDA
ncbi:MAG: metallophosphoesterase [Nanoarchaeota archaeon]|nr:metallophosphoesterase [Nanoarchaeota archaeon]